MKKIALLLACSLLCCAITAPRKPPKRPRILGIAGVTIYVSNIPEARKFYVNLIDPDRVCNYCEEVPGRYLFLPSGQRITLVQIPSPAPADLLQEICFLTDDLEAFAKYLHSHKIGYDEIRRKHTSDVFALQFDDPERRHIAVTDSFHLARSEEFNAGLPPRPPSSPLRIIHAGLLVRDREATDHFYKDVLGFRPYWHGGMKDDQTSWVAMQVPDGTDWVEYMLNISPTADAHTLGVMNHIALGVTDIHETEKRLKAAGAPVTEEPKIGRDGKWQLNLYDANLTRAEFMEFKPVQKPCCSEFTGPHPGPQ